MMEQLAIEHTRRQAATQAGVFLHLHDADSGARGSVPDPQLAASALMAKPDG